MIIQTASRPYTRPAPPPPPRRTAPIGWAWHRNHWYYVNLPDLQVWPVRVANGVIFWRTYFEGKWINALDHAYTAEIVMEMAYEYFDARVEL